MHLSDDSSAPPPPPRILQKFRFAGADRKDKSLHARYIAKPTVS